MAFAALPAGFAIPVWAFVSWAIVDWFATVAMPR
jgi:hypothetical protein